MDKGWIKQLKLMLNLVWVIMAGLVVLIMGIWLLVTFPEILKFPKKVESPTQLEKSSKTLLVKDQVKDGIHLPTGLVAGDGLEQVINNCTNCHAADLIIQNRGTREKWQELIQWMQETQGLWDLGTNEKIILDYLAKNYAPEQKGRRAPLTDIEWYELEEK